MDDIRYIFYKDKLQNIIQNNNYKNINILNIGCYNIEVLYIFLNSLNNSESKIICINSFKFDGLYKNYYDHILEINFIIENSEREKQIDVKDFSISDGINDLYYSKKYMFDIIFFDFIVNKDNLLLNIILTWELLNEDGIMIFDNYKCENTDNIYCPVFVIKTFLQIYSDDIKIIENDIEQFTIIILQKKKKHNVGKKTSLDKLFDQIYNYELPTEEFVLPQQEYVELDWKVEYHDDNYDVEEEIYKLYDDKLICKKMLKYDKNYKDIKNAEMNFLDYNYFAQSKRVSYDIYLKYLSDTYKDYNIDKLQIKKILDLFINNKTNDYNRTLNSVSYIKDIDKKTVNFLRLTHKYKTKYSNNFINIYENIFKKNIKIFLLYNKTEKKNNNDDTSKIISKGINISSHNSILDEIKLLNKKFDIIYFDKKFLSINYNDKNNMYIYILYVLFLYQQKKGSSIITISINILYNNIIYQIIYILSLYYSNIKFYLKDQVYLSENTIEIKCTNFKGIDDNCLNKIKNLCVLISNNNKKIKSIFNNKIPKLFFNKTNEYLYFLMNNKINHFKWKYIFNDKIKKKSYELKKKYFLKLFKKQLIFYLLYNKKIEDNYVIT